MKNNLMDDNISKITQIRSKPIVIVSGKKANVTRSLLDALSHDEHVFLWGFKSYNHYKNLTNGVNKYGTNIIVYVYVSKDSKNDKLKYGIIARGILKRYFTVVDAKNNLYWPDEISSGKILYPYRFELKLTHVGRCDNIEEILNRCLSNQECKELAECTIPIKEIKKQCNIKQNLPLSSIGWINKEKYNIDCIESYIQKMLKTLKQASRHYDPCDLKLKNIFDLKNNPDILVKIYSRALHKIFYLYIEERKNSFNKEDLNKLLYNVLLEEGIIDKKIKYEKFVKKKHHMLAPFYNDLRRLAILEIGSSTDWKSKEEARPSIIFNRLNSMFNVATDLGIDLSENLFPLVVLLCTAYGGKCSKEACLCKMLKKKDPRDVLGELFDPIAKSIKEISVRLFMILPLDPEIFHAIKKFKLLGE